MKSFQNTKIAKLAAIGAAISLFSGAVGYAAGEWENIWVQFDSVNLMVNGQNVTSSNLLYNDRTYVPLRACAEMLGSTVEWSQTSNTASITANTAGSADTAKVISDMQAVSIIMDRLDIFLELSGNLQSCYADCVTFANNLLLNANNAIDIHEQDLVYFNDIIENYNENLIYSNDIENALKQINIEYSQSSAIMEYYGECIDSLKEAYNKLYNYQSSNSKQIYNEAIIITNNAFSKIRTGNIIRKDLFTKVYEFSQYYK